LVEDNRDVLRYLELTLRRQGFRVATAASLAEARGAAVGCDFDLLISDIELKDGSGLDLMRELGPRGILGIAVSGYGSADDMHESRAAGFSAHLVKPVLAEALDGSIRRVLAKLQQGQWSDPTSTSATSGRCLRECGESILRKM
jgi:two-component system response regulator PilR (NtrC family)